MASICAEKVSPRGALHRAGAVESSTCQTLAGALALLQSVARERKHVCCWRASALHCTLALDCRVDCWAVECNAVSFGWRALARTGGIRAGHREPLAAFSARGALYAHPHQKVGSSFWILAPTRCVEDVGSRARSSGRIAGLACRPSPARKFRPLVGDTARRVLPERSLVKIAFSRSVTFCAVHPMHPPAYGTEEKARGSRNSATQTCARCTHPARLLPKVAVLRP